MDGSHGFGRDGLGRSDVVRSINNRVARVMR